MSEMSMDEIAVLSVDDGHLYAYIGRSSLGKDWPSEIVHGGLKYAYEDCWTLPLQMKTYVQAARYFVLTQ
jgi:hypothetical protein